VIVQPLAEPAERELSTHFRSIAAAMAQLYARYSDKELALLLDFTTRAGAVGQAETARLRRKSSQAPSQRDPPRQ
jgi:hypothetical protein